MSTWILFDLDGTLTDSGEGVMKSVCYALDRMGFPNEPESALRRFIGPPLHQSFIDFYGFSEEKAFEAVETMRERYREKGVYENHMLPGMKEMLAKLRAAGAKLCVATSKPLYFTEIILRQHGVDGLFTHVVGANLDGTMTDKTEVIREVLRRIGDAPGEKDLHGRRPEIRYDRREQLRHRASACISATPSRASWRRPARSISRATFRRSSASCSPCAKANSKSV